MNQNRTIRFLLMLGLVLTASTCENFLCVDPRDPNQEAVPEQGNNPPPNQGAIVIQPALPQGTAQGAEELYHDAQHTLEELSLELQQAREKDPQYVLPENRKRHLRDCLQQLGQYDDTPKANALRAEIQQLLEQHGTGTDMTLLPLSLQTETDEKVKREENVEQLNRVLQKVETVAQSLDNAPIPSSVQDLLAASEQLSELPPAPTKQELQERIQKLLHGALQHLLLESGSQMHCSKRAASSPFPRKNTKRSTKLFNAKSLPYVLS